MRVAPGTKLEPFALDTLSHGSLEVPGQGLTHLQFRRFASCPICNTHLRGYARRVGELKAAGIRPVVFFHTGAKAMQRYQSELPFAVVADPGRTWYRRFGVERSWLASMHPKAMVAAMKTMLGGGLMFWGVGPPDGLPAEFLVGEDGTVLAAKYGEHASDHWEVDEVLALANQPR